MKLTWKDSHFLAELRELLEEKTLRVEFNEDGQEGSLVILVPREQHLG